MHHLIHSAIDILAVWSAACAAIGGAFFGTIGYRIGKKRGRG